MGESVVPTTSITQVLVSSFLGITTFHIPPNGYSLYPSVSCSTDDQQMAEEGVRTLGDALALFVLFTT